RRKASIQLTDRVQQSWRRPQSRCAEGSSSRAAAHLLEQPHGDQHQYHQDHERNKCPVTRHQTDELAHHVVRAIHHQRVPPLLWRTSTGLWARTRSTMPSFERWLVSTTNPSI